MIFCSWWSSGEDVTGRYDVLIDEDVVALN